jgi:hypothetical protein
LIHKASSTLCGARTKEQSRSVRTWGNEEAVFDSDVDKWVDANQEFHLAEVDVEDESESVMVEVGGATIEIQVADILAKVGA